MHQPTFREMYLTPRALLILAVTIPLSLAVYVAFKNLTASVIPMPLRDKLAWFAMLTVTSTASTWLGAAQTDPPWWRLVRSFLLALLMCVLAFGILMLFEILGRQLHI